MPRIRNTAAAAALTLLTALCLATSASAVSFSGATQLPTGKRPTAVAVSDLDSDGIADLVGAENVANSVATFLGTGQGAFGTRRAFQVNFNPGPMKVASLNPDVDSIPDVVVANSSQGTVTRSLGQGDGRFAFSRKVEVGDGPESNPQALAVGDVDNDGKTDVIAANFKQDTISVLINDGTGMLAPQVKYPTGTGPVGVGIADFDEDGKNDVVVANGLADTVGVRLGTGGGALGPETTFPAAGGPTEMTIADLNRDGNLDVTVSDQQVGTVGVLLGDGHGGLGGQSTFKVGQYPRSVAVSDYDEDGIPDLAVANSGPSSVSVLAGKGDGTFASQVVVKTGLSPLSVAAGDLDGDGHVDLATADFDNNTISVVYNTSTTRLTPDAGEITFGAVAVDGTADARPVTVTATGAAAWVGPQVVPAGQDADSFTIVEGDTCQPLARVAIGQSCSFQVRFSPKSAGPKQTQIQLRDANTVFATVTASGLASAPAAPTGSAYPLPAAPPGATKKRKNRATCKAQRIKRRKGHKRRVKVICKVRIYKKVKARLVRGKRHKTLAKRTLKKRATPYRVVFRVRKKGHGKYRLRV